MPGAQLGEYLGVAVLLAMATVWIAVLLAVRRVALGSMRAPASDVPPEEEERTAPDAGPRVAGDAAPAPAELRRRVVVPFHRAVLLGLVVFAHALWLVPWAANLRTLGVPGLGAVALFSAPLVAGLAFAWSRGAFDC